MTSVIYASPAAFLVVWLSLNVIRPRRTKRAGKGNGNGPETVAAMVIRSNALEHIPVVLLLLYTLEYKGAYLMVVPGHGMLLLTARVIHANIILTNNPGRSMPGTRLAIGRFTGLAITGLTFCHLQESLIPGIPPRSAAGNSSNFRSWIQGAGNRFDPAFPASPGRRENC